MKKRVSEKFWFPFWVDKWIFGSMRIECTLEERAIWVDLLALAAKDDGHIRANEDIPYPIEQLAGMLRIPADRLKKAINKFVKLKKLTRLPNKTLYVTEWGKYQFSESYLRVRKYREKSRGGKIVTPKCDGDTNRIEQNRIEQNNKKDKRKLKFSDVHLSLAKLQESKIKERLPKHKFQGKQYLEIWANEYRLMEEKGEANFEEIERLLDWVYKDNFWYKNILSAEKLRKQFGRLWAEMEDKKPNDWKARRDAEAKKIMEAESK